MLVTPPFLHGGASVPRIIAAFAYRYEPDWMVEQLRENLSWVDGFAELNDRARTEPWGNTAERNAAVLAIAREMGAEWVYFTAPDERLQNGAGEVLRRLAASGRHDRYRLCLREMWTPDSYRVDGVWGRKRRTRFYRLDTAGKGHPLDLDIYHLKMIDNRAERARVHSLYNTWDNGSRGFDYMTDERGLVLERIPADRGFLPPYTPYRFEVTG